jgi:uncharacterized protein YbcV (DUF1398 family)
MQMQVMQAEVKSIVEDCTKGSDDGRLTFPEVVMRLAGAGVERYLADLCRSEKTFYLPNGASHRVASAALARPPAQMFSAPEIEAAIRAIQAKAIDYHTFCTRIAAAGCVFYIVSITGRRAVYLGRGGDSFVEPFPAAK